MSWGRRILIGASLVLVLLIAMVLIAGYLSVGDRSAMQSMSMTVGNRTVTVSGHYQNMTQESLADGVKVMVDGHEILVSGDQITADGKAQVIEPDQDVEILVDEKGALSVKVVSAGSGGPADAAQ